MTKSLKPKWFKSWSKSENTIAKVQTPIVFADFDHDLKHSGFRDFVIKYIIDDHDDHDNDDKDDNSCNSVNFKVRSSRFYMELDINNI